MNIEEYIASGILELYVLGELSAVEAAEVEEMAARHPEVQKEIRSIQEALEGMAMQSAIHPRAGLKNEILNKIKMSEAPSGSASTIQDATIRKREKTISLLQFGVAASVAVAIISIIAALYFRSQWKNTEERLSDLLVQNQQIAEQYKTANQELQQLSQELSVISNRNFQAIEMTGLEPAPNSLAHVYWNQNSNQVYLKVDALPPNAPDKQYQLWAIVDGKPVSAGVFDVKSNERQKLIPMESIGNASAFAVTLEPQGGSESPTLDAMYVHGTVEST